VSLARAPLQRAAAAATERDRLEALLDAWRAHRHPRIAELIERLSAKLIQGSKPIKGKSVADRLETITTLCTKADPVEVGRVLASEWPGTWQTALPMLKAVRKLPDDPRVARVLAEQVDLTRYDTWTSKAFYGPLFSRLNALRDVRQLPLLEAQLTRNKTYYYERDMRPMEERAVEVLRAVSIEPLSPEEEALIASLETPFASQAANETDTERSGERLLAAVFERPTDLAARAVYGDWLTEHKDPRGELISLQLGPPSEKSARRIEALLKKHWQTWLGPLADWFRKPPVFEAGFPVDGRVESPSHRAGREAFAPLVERPEWSTFRRLAVPSNLITPAELVRFPRFRNVTALPEVRSEELSALLDTGSPTVRWLEVMWCEREPLRPGAFGKFPALEVLRVFGTNLPVFAAAVPSTLKRLEFVVRHADPVDEWAKLLAPVRAEIVIDNSGGQALLRHDGSRFTEAVLLGHGSAAWLLDALPTTLRAITSAGLEKQPVPQGFLDELDRRLSRFPELKEVDLPFVAEAARPPPPPHVTLDLSGFAFFEEARLATLWKILTESFGVPFDTLDVRGGLPLGDDPVEKLTTWCRNKRCRDTSLMVEGTPSRFRLMRERDLFSSAQLPRGDPERFIAALTELLAFAKPSYLMVSWAKRSITLKEAEVRSRIAEVHALLRSPPAATAS